jgi:hypothetical protein
MGAMPRIPRKASRRPLRTRQWCNAAPAGVSSACRYVSCGLRHFTTAMLHTRLPAPAQSYLPSRSRTSPIRAMAAHVPTSPSRHGLACLPPTRGPPGPLLPSPARGLLAGPRGMHAGRHAACTRGGTQRAMHQATEGVWHAAHHAAPWAGVGRAASPQACFRVTDSEMLLPHPRKRGKGLRLRIAHQDCKLSNKQSNHIRRIPERRPGGRPCACTASPRRAASSAWR